MSIIDEKGKIGGKVNIIDLIVILVVLAAIAAVVVLGGRGSGVPGAQAEHIIYQVKVEGVDADVFKTIQSQIPGELVASEELQDGYVTDVEGVLVEEDDEARMEAAANGFNGYYVGLHPGQAGTYDVIFTIEANLADPGWSHIVKTTTFVLDHGTIISREVVPPEG